MATRQPIPWMMRLIVIGLHRPALAPVHLQIERKRNKHLCNLLSEGCIVAACMYARLNNRYASLSTRTVGRGDPFKVDVPPFPPLRDGASSVVGARDRSFDCTHPCDARQCKPQNPGLHTYELQYRLSHRGAFVLETRLAKEEVTIRHVCMSTTRLAFDARVPAPTPMLIQSELSRAASQRRLTFSCSCNINTTLRVPPAAFRRSNRATNSNCSETSIATTTFQR